MKTTNDMEWGDWFSNFFSNPDKINENLNDLAKSTKTLFSILEEELDRLWHQDMYKYISRLNEIKKEHKDYKILRNSVGIHKIVYRKA